MQRLYAIDPSGGIALSQLCLRIRIFPAAGLRATPLLSPTRVITQAVRLVGSTIVAPRSLDCVTVRHSNYADASTLSALRAVLHGFLSRLVGADNDSDTTLIASSLSLRCRMSMVNQREWFALLYVDRYHIRLRIQHTDASWHAETRIHLDA